MGITGPQGDGLGFPLTPSSSWAFSLRNAGSWASPSLSPLQASPALAAARCSRSLREAPAWSPEIEAGLTLLLFDEITGTEEGLSAVETAHRLF